jgi:WD40 repeat protein
MMSPIRRTAIGVANPSRRVAAFNWHPSGRWLAVADLSGNVHQMDAQTGETRGLGRHKAEAVRTEFTPDGDYMMSGAWGGEIFCWDAKTLQRAFNIRLDTHFPQFRADGRVCAVTTTSGVQLHAFERPSGYHEFPEDLGPRLAQAAFSPDGRWLAASGDKRMAVWDLTAGGPGALDENAHAVHCFFTPDGRELFGSRSRRPGNDDCFRWRITPATDAGGTPQLERLQLHKPVGFAFLSLSSNSVVMTSTNGTQVLASEEVETGKEVWSRTYAGINRVSPDARWVGIFRHFSPSLYVYRLPGLERVAKLNLWPTSISSSSPRWADEVALFSKRGVELWSTATWERTRLLTNLPTRSSTRPMAEFLAHPQPGIAGLYDARTLKPRLLLAHWNASAGYQSGWPPTRRECGIAAAAMWTW